MNIYVIDHQGEPTNDETTMTCNNGICNLKTVSFNNLYEYDTDDNGILEDVSEGVQLQGKAILEFANTGDNRRLSIAETLASTVKKKEKKEVSSTKSKKGEQALIDMEYPNTPTIEAHADADLKEVVGSENQTAETSFVVDVALQTPPKDSSQHKQDEMPSVSSALTNSPMLPYLTGAAIFAFAIV